MPAPPIIREVEQLDNDGLFSVKVEMPGQGTSVPVRTDETYRYYTLRLYIDGRVAEEVELPEGGLHDVTFTYDSNVRAVLMGSTVTGDGDESDIQECRSVIAYQSKGFVVDFERCDNATMSDCVFEGRFGGVIARSSSVQLLDCEIILDGGTFVRKDGGASVLEQNLRKVTR